jgi:hypothetical protein
VDIKGEKPHGWDIAKSKFSLSAWINYFQQ